MLVLILFIICIIICISCNNYEKFDDIYNYKYSDDFKKMFTQPTIWLGYQEFDGIGKTQKLYINNYDKPT